MVAIVRDGYLAFFDHCGNQDVEKRQPITDDTIFRIFSMSKPVTAVAAMILIERGLLKLDDPVSKFIPEFSTCKVYVSGDTSTLKTESPKQHVTIKHLLTHTSGIAYGKDAGPGAVDAASKVVAGIWHMNGLDSIEGVRKQAGAAKVHSSLIDWAKHVPSVPLLFQPGTSWFYGYNIDVLGAVIEVIAGVSLRDFLKAEIFEPLGMIDTDFVVPKQKKDRLATLYERRELHDGSGCLHACSAYVDADEGKVPEIHIGGAGLFSTMHDYLRFSQMLLNGGTIDGVRVLGRSTVEFMTSNHLPKPHLLSELDWGCGYSETDLNGMGFCLGMSLMLSPADFGVACSTGEVGWGGWASTWFAIDPKERLVAVLLTQLCPSTAYPLRKELRNLIYGAIIN
jgi:CubicO group peptidase (beta-lactamase class C family)